jgi:PPM family protein phosphatase
MNLMNSPSRGTKFCIIAAGCSEAVQTHNHGKGALELCERPDHWLIRQFGKLYLLAEGVQGHAAGEIASRIAVETIPECYYDQEFPEEYLEEDMTSAGGVNSPLIRLQRAFFAAHTRIRRLSTYQQEYAGMATSCVAAVVRRNGLWVAHVGNCRAYLIRTWSTSQREIICLTTDHSLIIRLVMTGDVSPEQACSSPVRHILLRALGGWEGTDPSPDFAVRELRAGDHIVLCSDGLWSTVTEKQMAQVVWDMPPQEACVELVRLAMEAGSTENNSAIVLCLLKEGKV